MVMNRKTRNTSLNTSLKIWIGAGVSAFVLAAIVVTFATRPVHADVRISRPAALTPPAATLVTPASLAPTSPVPAQATVQSPAHALAGIASWYGAVLNGHRTASGERFDMYAMTACHPTLPFGTLVRVVDNTTDRSVVVRINDRGELSEGRIIDLSYAAAEKLKIVRPGLASVTLEVISMGHARHKK